jgi:hypothetical protein
MVFLQVAAAGSFLVDAPGLLTVPICTHIQQFLGTNELLFL